MMKQPKYTPPPAPAPPPNAPQQADASVLAAGADIRRRAMANFGQTLLTGPLGVQTDAQRASKTLLGQ